MEALPIIDGCRANLEMTKCQRNPGWVFTQLR
jgi:hypothetical protein